MAAPKRHHYVPQFYLGEFTDPSTGTFWVYDKEDPQKPRAQAPKDTTVERYFYTVETPEGKRDHRGEAALAELDGSASPILKRWQIGGARASGDELAVVATFLAVMHARVPRTIAALKEMEEIIVTEECKTFARQPERLQASLDRYQKETGKEAPTRDEIQEALQALEREEIVIEEGGKFPMAMAFRMAPLVADHLLQLNWCICDAPSDKFFVTSDTPLVVFAQEGSQAIFGGGLGLPHVEVSFPISPLVCLCLDRHHTQRRRRIAADVVDELNRRTVCMAERFIIAPRKAKQIEALVAEFAHTRGRPKMDRAEIIRTLRDKGAVSQR